MGEINDSMEEIKKERIIKVIEELEIGLVYGIDKKEIGMKKKGGEKIKVEVKKIDRE